VVAKEKGRAAAAELNGGWLQEAERFLEGRGDGTIPYDAAESRSHSQPAEPILYHRRQAAPILYHRRQAAAPSNQHQAISSEQQQ
jgi:hypothetical protein